MSSIQNRFSGLQLNIKNPTDVVLPKTRAKKSKAKPQKKTPISTGAGQKVKAEDKPLISDEPSVNVQAKTADKKIEVNQKMVSEKISPVVSDKIKEKPSVSVKDNFKPKTQNRAQDNALLSPRKMRETPHEPEPLVDLDGEDASRPNFRSHDHRETDETFEGYQDDDRAVRPRRAYQKMVLTAGRMYDRHTGLKTGFRFQEKRHGHGRYNWGDQANEESNVDLKDESTVLLEGESVLQSVGEKEGESQNPEFTLEEYRNFVKEQKIVPIYRGDGVPSKVTDLKNEDKGQSRGGHRGRFRQRDGRENYSRGEFQSRRPGQGRQSNDGESESGNRRGGFHQRRPFNATRGNLRDDVSGVKSETRAPKAVNLDVDDFSHFPQL